MWNEARSWTGLKGSLFVLGRSFSCPATAGAGRAWIWAGPAQMGRLALGVVVEAGMMGTHAPHDLVRAVAGWISGADAAAPEAAATAGGAIGAVG